MKWTPEKLPRTAGADSEGRVRVCARAIYIFPTRYGIIYGIAIFVMLLGSLNYRSNLGLLFTFLFMSLGIVSILHTWRNLLGIELRIATPSPVFAGGTAVFSGQMTAADDKEKPRIQISAGKLTTKTVDVDPGGQNPFVLRIPAPQRGLIALGRIRISTVFPLGFLRAWSYAETGAGVLVYPRPAVPTPLVTHPHYVRSEQGDKGIGADDFVGLRPYRAGDPPRHLDWKAFARERGLVIRQFGGDRAEQVYLDWESLTGLDMEQRLSRLCRMVLDASGEDMRYGLKLPRIRIPPAAGDAHRHRCLAALARFGDTVPQKRLS